MQRRPRIVIGAVLIVAGLIGVLALGTAFPASARPGSVATHETMNQMMDVMQGSGTVDRMHAIPGAEEMMAQCAALMAASGGMMSAQR